MSERSRLAGVALLAITCGLAVPTTDSRRAPRPGPTSPVRWTTVAGRVSTPGDTPLAGALVYLGATPALSDGVGLPPAQARVKGCRLEPAWLTVVVGQKLIVDSDDAEPHALRFESLDPEHGRGIASGRHWEQTFTRPCAGASVTCSIHPGLLGRVSVVPNPAFVRSDSGGRFCLAVRVPAGRYEVRAFHPEYRPSMDVIETVPGVSASVDFPLTPATR